MENTLLWHENAIQTCVTFLNVWYILTHKGTVVHFIVRKWRFRELSYLPKVVWVGNRILGEASCRVHGLKWYALLPLLIGTTVSVKLSHFGGVILLGTYYWSGESVWS